MENSEQDLLSHVGLEVDNEVRQQFTEAAKWSKFISIVMFVASGLILLLGVLGGSLLWPTLSRLGGTYDLLNGLGGPLIIGLIALIAIIMAVIYYFLYNFSQKTKAALLSDNATELNAGLKSLKIFFIITTILAIASLLLNLFNLFI